MQSPLTIIAAWKYLSGLSICRLWVVYLSAGAYIAIMLAVLGVPQLISSYFDLRARRLDRLENEANAERRHQENLAAEARREERQEERRREEQRVEGERRREEQRVEEEHRREERRQDSEIAERRHTEMMTLLAAVLNNGSSNGNGQNEIIRTLQQTIDDLRAENDRLRQQNGNSGQSSDSS